MRSLNDLRVLPWIAVATLVVAAVIAVPSHHNAIYARTQEPDLAAAATPTDYGEFQYATLTGTTNTINATMVPVVTGTTTKYKDITIQFSVSAAGVVTYVGEPTVVNSAVTAIAGFKAGTYVGPSTLFAGMGEITVSGPGVAAGGATEWSLATAAGSPSSTYPQSATWYVGPPTSTNNPLYARLHKDGITSTAYSYGILGTAAGGGGAWDAGALLGFSQSGNAITIVSFSQNGTDYPTPQEQITYLLK